MYLLTGGGTYSATTWRNAAVEYLSETKAYVVTVEFPATGMLEKCTIWLEDMGGKGPGMIQISYGLARPATKRSM